MECFVCGKTFSSKNPDQSFCTVKCYNSWEGLVRHRMSHKENVSYNCTVCNQEICCPDYYSEYCGVWCMRHVTEGVPI